MYESLMAVKHNSILPYSGKIRSVLISLISIMSHIKLHYEKKLGQYTNKISINNNHIEPPYKVLFSHFVSAAHAYLQSVPL